MNLDAHIEALLFFKGEPVSVKEIQRLSEREERDVEEALENLTVKLQERGLSLIRKDKTVQLVTDPQTSATIKKAQKERLTRTLSKAGLETVSIILYKGPIKSRDIDYIRGVNSQYILRNLLVRGLITKKKHNNQTLYEPTLDLISHLGLSSQDELPEYTEVKKELEEDTEEHSA